MAKITDLVNNTKTVDVSRFFKGSEKVKCVIKRFNKKEELAINNCLIRNEDNIMEKAKDEKLGLDIKFDPDLFLEVYKLKLLYGVTKSPIDEGWDMGIIEQLMDLNPGLLDYLFREIEEHNRPLQGGKSSK